MVLQAYNRAEEIANEMYSLKSNRLIQEVMRLPRDKSSSQGHTWESDDGSRVGFQVSIDSVGNFFVRVSDPERDRLGYRIPISGRDVKEVTQKEFRTQHVPEFARLASGLFSPEELTNAVEDNIGLLI